MDMEQGHFDTQHKYIEEVAAYIRVSTQEQKMHGISLDAQEQKLQEYADKNNMKIVEWYKDEGISGRKLIKKRPELQRMIKDAQKGRFKRILFIKLDRFFRSVAEYHECMKLIEPVIWTATEEKYDLSTANGRAFVNMKLTIGELEADTTGERIKIVNEYKIKSGLPLFGTTSMPFCYAVEHPKAGERNKYIVKRNQEIMEDLISHIMTNKTVRGAVGYINGKYNAAYHYNGILKVLKNEMICGYYKGNPNYCEPFISREEFEQLQEIIKRNPRTTPNEHTYIFTGLVVCPECGNRLNGTMHHQKAGDRRYRYYSYRCNRNRLSKICSFNKAIFEKRLETTLLNRLDEIIADKKAKSIEIAKSDSERVSKYNIDELKSELERLNYSWQKGRIKSVEEYDRQYDELMERIDSATQEAAEISTEPDYERVEALLSDGWQDIYNELDAEHKRAFWRSLVSEIHITWTNDQKTVDDVIFF
jgi:DNA invertase Pin-like site-specific DNA recombinase